MQGGTPLLKVPPAHPACWAAPLCWIPSLCSSAGRAGGPAARRTPHGQGERQCPPHQPFHGWVVGKEGTAASLKTEPSSRGRAGTGPALGGPLATSPLWSEVTVTLPLGPCLLLTHGLQEGQLLGLLLLVPGLVLQPGGQVRVSGAPRPRPQRLPVPPAAWLRLTCS